MSRYRLLISRNETGVTSTTTARASSRKPYIRSGIADPVGDPAADEAADGDAAEETREDRRDRLGRVPEDQHQLARPDDLVDQGAAPDSTKIGRGWRERIEQVRVGRRSDLVGPVDAEGHDDHAERDQHLPARSRPLPRWTAARPHSAMTNGTESRK